MLFNVTSCIFLSTINLIEIRGIFTFYQFYYLYHAVPPSYLATFCHVSHQ